MATQVTIRELIAEELKKCAGSPVYFMKKYCKISHPTRGKLLFQLYDFQVDVLNQLLQHDYNIILKSRQLGISTLCAGFSLWLMLFNSDKSILVVATKQEVAKNLITKVRYMYQNLPDWIKRVAAESTGKETNDIGSENNKLSLRLSNGSQIKATSSASDAGRSESLSMLIIDEAAFIEEEKVEKIWVGAQQTLATGGRGIVLSTPNGSGNWFFREWGKAEAGGKMHPIRLPWYVHPDHDQAWRDEQEQLLGKRGAAQECDCDFTTSGNTVVDSDIIKFFKETHVEAPVEKRGFDGNLWYWQYPDYSRGYIVAADVARGDGSDFSAFHVIDIVTATQVAEYRGLISTTDFGNMCVNIATEFNNALLVIENANVGWAAIQPALDRGYKNLFYSYKDINYLDDAIIAGKRYDLTDKANMVPGFTTSRRSRPLIISKMELYMREKECVIKSTRLMHEHDGFIWKGSKAQAQPGANDDLIMSWAIGLWVRDTALKLNQRGIDLTKSTLNCITNTAANAPKIQSSLGRQTDPWSMNLGQGGTMNLKELL